MKRGIAIQVILAAASWLRLCIPQAGGAEITASAAKEYAAQWLSGRTAFKVAAKADAAARGSVRTVRDAARKALYHVVGLDGGGFVVVAGDDAMTGVIAFSEAGEFSEDERNPLWLLLRRDIPMRLAAASGSAASKVATSNLQPLQSFAGNSVPKAGAAAIDDMRVPPIVKSKWDQTTVGGKAVYNFHTPSGMPCGCVATAAAQVMRYHEYPLSTVESRDFLCEVGGRDSTLTTIGGVYDWSLMPLVPDSSISDAEQEMIGRLVYDAGVASCMSYGYSGSGTIAYYTQDSLKDLFHYSQAVYAEQFSSKTGVLDALENALLANFDAGCPVMMGISGKDMTTRQNVGHEIVGDGYGYVGDELYVHLNLGWSGDWDAWYNLPNIDAYSGRSGVNFNLFDDMVYNIFPTDTLEIVSGRVLGADGTAIAGALVEAVVEGGDVVATAESTAYGIYALKIGANQTVTIRAEFDGLEGDGPTVTTGMSQNYTTYFGETHAASLLQSVGNRWGNDVTIEAGSCAAPAFSRPSCAFVDELVVECSQPDDKAKIRYTTDGSEPTAASQEWPADGLRLRTTTTLKAKTFRSGMADSTVATATYTDYPLPRISGGALVWEKPVGATCCKVFKSSNRFGSEIEECTDWISENSYAAAPPSSVEEAVFYFVRASSRPSDEFASPLSDAVPFTTPDDPETGAKTQVLRYIDAGGGTNTAFRISDFPVIVPAVYYDTAGAFGPNGFFKVNVPTTSRKNIPLQENAVAGIIKTTKVISSAKFGEADGTLFMGDNSSGAAPLAWRLSLYYEQGGATNYAGEASISESPVCFHFLQQCASSVALGQESLELAGSATNAAFLVECPREHVWRAVSDAEWLEVLRPTGRGSCHVRLAADANPDAQQRSATVTVSCGKSSRTLRVVQGAHVDEPDPIVQAQISLVATAGTKKNSVFLHWTAVEGALAYEIYRSEDEDAMPDEPYWTSTNSIPALIDFGVQPGEVYHYRVVAATQAGRTQPSPSVAGWAAAVVSVSSRQVEFDATGGVFRVVVESNAGWAVGTDAEWLSLNAIDTERNGVLDITAIANSSLEERTATLTFIGGELRDKPVTNSVVVVQSPAASAEVGAEAASRQREGSLAEDCANADSTARAVLTFCDGAAHVGWTSQLSPEEQEKYLYTLWGKASLDPALPWRRLDDADAAERDAMRFFKVSSVHK